MTTLNFALTRTLGARLSRRRRDRRDAARPRRERLALARARARPRDRVAFVGHRRRLPARPGRPGAPAVRADEGRRLSSRVERGRHAASTSPRVAELAHWRARSPGRTPCTTRRTGRSTSPVRRRRAPLLAVQVLRPAPGHGVRAARAPRALAAVQGAPGAGGASRTPLRDTARFNTSSSPATSPPSSTSTRSAGTRSWRTRTSSAKLPRGPARGGRAVRAADDGRPRADLRLQSPGPHARERSRHGWRRANIAVWHGDYYALEVMRLLELEGRAPFAPASSTTTPRTKWTAC